MTIACLAHDVRRSIPLRCWATAL